MIQKTLIVSDACYFLLWKLMGKEGSLRFFLKVMNVVIYCSLQGLCSSVT